ncbi:MAG TPA: alpha/beta fold hydrolase [Streptosporangiaceae bacterium]|jgi:pimeloyl-ACP methyl ester carboxylesterase|nr:alpha/beta fold hydrolase [Streptosporangiaceae bacterium]
MKTTGSAARRRHTPGIKLGLKHITGAADLAPEGQLGSWVSDAAREKFMAAYERAFALWPQPCEELDIETATATTRVHAYRPHPGGEPVVLLSAFNAASWYPQVAALAQDGPVYGIDVPGDASPSIPRALMTPPENCAAWLDELLRKLSDRPAHLVGFSYGGWIAMNQAIRAPGRVASITLLDPAGLTKLDARFWWWLSISGLATLTPRPLRRRLARWLDSPAMMEPELMTLMWAGIRGYRAQPKFPDVLTDDELRAITVPVLLITGARSALITPAQARDRASRMPHAEVAIVPGSHGGFNRIDELNDRIAAFIKAQTTGERIL